MQNQLHINDKQAFLNRIDYWIKEGNFKEALKLADMFIEYNGASEEIIERKITIKKNDKTF